MDGNHCAEIRGFWQQLHLERQELFSSHVPEEVREGKGGGKPEASLLGT